MLTFYQSTPRRRLTQEQLARLEAEFLVSEKPSAALKKELSQLFGIPERSIQIWFQNR